MRKYRLIFIACFGFSAGFTQTGPGGVGSAANNLIWFDVDREGLANNSTVSFLTDFSGNGINATGASGPTYQTNQINGRSALTYSGSQVLQIASNNALDNLGQLSWFVVYSSTANSGTAFANRYSNSATGWDSRHQNTNNFSSRAIRGN